MSTDGMPYGREARPCVDRTHLCAPYSFGRLGHMDSFQPILWYHPTRSALLLPVELIIRNYDDLDDAQRSAAVALSLGLFTEREADCLLAFLAEQRVASRRGDLALPIWLSPSPAPRVCRLMAQRYPEHVIRLDLFPDYSLDFPVHGLPGGVGMTLGSEPPSREGCGILPEPASEAP